MTLSSEQRAVLIELLRKLTPGELSTVVASLSEPGSRIGTSTNSRNYAFLQQLSAWGLASELSLDVDLPPELQTVLTSFSIQEEAKAEIAELIRTASVDREHDERA